MKMNKLKKFLFTATAVAMFIISTATASPAHSTRIDGQTTSLGNGTLSSWVELDNSRKPTAIGVTFTEKALSGLAHPTEKGPYPTSDGHPSHEYEVMLPKEAEATPFNHVGVNWNPRGHHPDEVYAIPHFDFHFYTITPEIRKQITLTGDSLAKARKLPSKEYWPQGYLPALAQSPGQMGSEEHKQGLHWVNLVNPTFLGRRFAEVFLYGSYDGEFNFWEPMITKEYLETHPNVTKSIKQAKVYAKSGYYPTEYNIKYDAARKEYTVSMSGLTYRDAIPVPKPNSTLNT